jgi:hypothetical protein
VGRSVGAAAAWQSAAVRRPGPRTILVVVIVLGGAAWIAGFAVYIGAVGNPAIARMRLSDERHPCSRSLVLLLVGRASSGSPHSARTAHDARLVGAEDLLGMWRSSRLLAPGPAMEFQFRTLRAARKASRLRLAAALDVALTVPS